MACSCEGLDAPAYDQPAAMRGKNKGA